MDFTKEDMLNIRSCIKKRGTISQRKALSRWENTTGYLIATKQYEKMRARDKREIARLENILYMTRLFIGRNCLLNDYNKELEEYINDAS